MVLKFMNRCGKFKVTLQNSNSLSESRLADTTNKKKKPHRLCPFCYKLQSAMSRHIQKCQKEKEEVKASMSLPGPERSKAFTNLKKRKEFIITMLNY